MVKSDVSVMAYGLVIVLIIVVIVLVVMFCSKCTKRRESFKQFKNKRRDMRSRDKGEFNCEEDEYQYTTMFAGSNIASGCLQNQGGTSEEFKRTNKIACGDTGRYICQNIVTRKGDSSIGCGCLEKMDKDDPRVIIPEIFIR